MSRKLILLLVLLLCSSQALIIGVGACGNKLIVKETPPAVEEKETTVKDKKQNKDPDQEKKAGYLLAEFVTTANSEDDRNHNLEVACMKIDGKKIAPNEIFSYNEVAGPYTEEEGYVKGPVIVNGGELSEAVGGGVCQVSTTLYNAALMSGLDSVERHRHSFALDYVNVGLDAMISYPEQDMKFKNISDQTIMINAFHLDGMVTVQLVGLKHPIEQEIAVESLVEKELEPEGDEIQLSTELKPGETKVLREARKGYQTKVIRTVQEDGEIIKKETISEDTYPAVHAVVLEGTNKSK